MRIMLITTNILFESCRAVALGPLYIGASLEKCGYEVKCIDMPAAKLEDEDVLKEVKKWQPDTVGFSCLYFSYPSALKTASKIKEKYPEIKTVFGGPHPSFKPRNVALEDAVDYVVIGEGEETLPELVDVVENGGGLNKIKGIAYKSNGSIVLTPPRPRIEDLDSLAHPAWHLLDRSGINSETYGTIVTSRGCPWNCIFCSTSAFHGHKMRFHSVDWVIDEFEVVSGLFDKIMVGDDHFTVNKRRAVKICEELERKGIRTNFWAETRSDVINHDLVRALKSAGCTQLCLGVESAEDTVLKIIAKRISVEQSKRAVRVVEEGGLDATVSFIVGLPGQTRESVVESTRNFVVETKPTEVNLNVLMLISGAPVYETPDKYGVKLLDTPGYFIVPFSTESMSWKDIINAYEELLDSLMVLSLVSKRPKRVFYGNPRDLRETLKIEEATSR